MIRVGILTSRKNWFNDEVAVSTGGQFFNIGLVEFEHRWSPFTFPSSDNYPSSSESSGDDNDEDGISDTDREEEGSVEMEEGEEVKIQAWENHEKRKAEMETKTMEVTF